MARFALFLTVFLAFTGWSTAITLQEGYFGFLTNARDHAWGRQVLVDLVIALSLAMGWLIKDAPKRGMNPWPYVVAAPLVGSISPLFYLVVREWKRLRTPASAPPAT